MDGNFYGTAPYGGAASMGCIFQMTPDGTFAVLHSFGGVDGEKCVAPLIQGGDGNFYGTTAQGGPPEQAQGYGGTVFRMTPDGTLTTLHIFNVADGYAPTSALVEGIDGNFYGTVPTGPPLFRAPDKVAFNTGSIFRVASDGTFTTLRYLSLSSPPTRALEVPYRVTGSAEPGRDYEPLSGAVKFKPGQTSALIRVKPKTGADQQNNTKVRIKLMPNDGYTLGPTTPFKITVLR